MAKLLRLTLGLALSLIALGSAAADPAPFDLAGPILDVQVTHAGVILPISQAPNLAAGDTLAIRADLPEGEVHYLLVAGFLRGAANPPPRAWFFRDETWTKAGRDGVKVVVPAGAQQVVVFLAPQTGGDFAAIVDAVRGRPGAFVRASQDLNQATLDRSRLDVFLAALHRDNPEGVGDPDHLKAVSSLLARSLALKLDAKCFDRTPDLQAACLSQGGDSLVLNDGHSTSIVDALTSGAAFDLVQQLSATPQAGFGFYSPYVAAAADLARILESFHTAQYQYIPALASTHGSKLSLVLNTPPSFHNPMSVLVAALPAVEPPQAPPLRPVDATTVACAQKPGLVLPVDGAPLVFSTAYAHGLVLRLAGPKGTVDLPVRADAEKGGLVVDTSALDPAGLAAALEGTLHGFWGFAPFDGPRFRLQTASPAAWRVAPDDQQALIVGRDDSFRLQGEGAACVESVAIQRLADQPQPLVWREGAADQLVVDAPLQAVDPGPVTLLVKSYGAGGAAPVAMQAFAQPGHLDSFAFHAGDAFGVLKGTRLDEVSGLALGGAIFRPGALVSAGGADALTLSAESALELDKLKPGQTVVAKVALKDGRALNLKVAVEPPRPSVELIGKSVQPQAQAAGDPIRLSGDDQLPQGAVITFSIRAQVPAAFSTHETVEVATADGAATAVLTTADGLTFEDPHVALATLNTAKAFGTSAFGPLRFRIVDGGAAGDWRPLATLVRLPVVQDLKCSGGTDRPCELAGANLFLLDSVSSGPGFDNAAHVPEGYTGSALPVPHPVAGRLFVRLHDDPSVVNQLLLPDAQPPIKSARGRG